MAVIAAGCGGAGGVDTSSTASGGLVATQPTPADAPTTTPRVAASTTEDSPVGGLPAGCAEGFAEYLGQIESVVVEFDPASANVGEYFRFDDAVSDKSIEILTANDYAATYNCSAVGLEWAYFDYNTPWDLVIEFATVNAPGTVAYLETTNRLSATDNGVMSDYGVASCDDAVAGIQKAVADQKTAGNTTLAHMGLDEGLALLGLYNAYLGEVRENTCPRDVLGNDEFGFMIERLPSS